MNDCELKSCRGCLQQDNVSAMFDLAVPNIKNIFSECTYTVFEIASESGDVPQFLCTVCYRFCELWKGFRDRCQENQKKINCDREMMSDLKTELSLTEDPLDDESACNNAETYVEGLEEDKEEDEDEDEESVTSDTYFPPSKRRNKSQIPEEVKEGAVKFGPGPNNKGHWKHFLRSEDKRSAKCNHCDKVVKTTCSTNGLWDHLGTHGITKDQQYSEFAPGKHFLRTEDKSGVRCRHCGISLPWMYSSATFLWKHLETHRITRDTPDKQDLETIMKNKIPENQLPDIKFGPGPNQRGVWLHFLRSEGRNMVKCKYCNKVLKTRKSSTGDMWQHLKPHGIHRGQEFSAPIIPDEQHDESQGQHDIAFVHVPSAVDEEQSVD